MIPARGGGGLFAGNSPSRFYLLAELSTFARSLALSLFVSLSVCVYSPLSFVVSLGGHHSGVQDRFPEAPLLMNNPIHRPPVICPLAGMGRSRRQRPSKTLCTTIRSLSRARYPTPRGSGGCPLTRTRGGRCVVREVLYDVAVAFAAHLVACVLHRWDHRGDSRNSPSTCTLGGLY